MGKFSILVIFLFLMGCASGNTSSFKSSESFTFLDWIQSPRKLGRFVGNDPSSSPTRGESDNTQYADTNIDGLWALSKVECPPGIRTLDDVDEFFSNQNNSAQFTFDGGMLKIRLSDKACRYESSGPYIIEGAKVVIGPFKTNRLCPGAAPREDTGEGGQGSFDLRFNKNGETELVLEIEEVESCSNNSRGKLIFIRVPMG